MNEVQSGIERGIIGHRSKAIKQIKELIPDEVDLSSTTLPDARSVNCSGEINPLVTSYDMINTGLLSQTLKLFP